MLKYCRAIELGSYSYSVSRYIYTVGPGKVHPYALPVLPPSFVSHVESRSPQREMSR